MPRLLTPTRGAQELPKSDASLFSHGEVREGRTDGVALALSALAAFVLLFSLSFALDLDGSLGSDSGGKVATINAMAERGDWNVGLGYWVEDLDPTGFNTPFYGTQSREKGWINITSLPMILATKPLVDLAGPRARFAFPILGTILAGLAAAGISSRFGAFSRLPAFWVTTMASSSTIYALDFWEHSMGIAFMVGGALLAIDVIRNEGSLMLPKLIGIGLLFGAAATMRQEAFVYGFVTGGTVVVGDLRMRRWRSLGRGTVMAISALLPLGLNAILERAFYGQFLRGQRSLGTITTASEYGVGERLRDGLFVLVSPISYVTPAAFFLGFAVVLAAAWAAFAALTERDLRRPGLAVALTAVPLLVRSLAFGPAFIPGLLIATPMAVLGIVMAVHYRDELIIWLALGPVPLVWLVQYRGATQAQWGGRYLLPSGAILLAYALGRANGTAPSLVRCFIIANAVVAGLGLWMLVDRTQAFGSAHQELASRSESVLVFNSSLLAREAAPLGWDRRWLSAGTDESKAEAAELLKVQSIRSFIFVAYPNDTDALFTGFEAEGSELIHYGDFFPMELTSYVATD